MLIANFAFCIETKMNKAWVKELKGIIWIVLALAIFLSLLTYSPNDPSLFHQSSAPALSIENLMGYPGAYLAGTMLRLLGLATYALPAVIFIFGGLIFWDKPCKSLWWVMVGTIGFLVSLSALLYFYFPDSPWSHSLIGSFIYQVLIRNLNLGGTLAILVTIISLSLFLIIPLPLRSLQEGFLSLCQKIVSGVGKGFGYHHKRREKSLGSKRSLISSAMIGHGQEKEDDKQPMGVIPSSTNKSGGDYQPPPLNLLDNPPSIDKGSLNKELGTRAGLLEQRLKDFGVQGRVVQILKGPVITMYEFEPGPGVKVSKIMNLSDDLALAMKALSVRIVAPVPGKSVVGIEIPNDIRCPVSLKEILDSPTFRQNRSKLPLALGKDILGNPVVTDLAQIPHLLIAGATGSGKSVGLNGMICSLLFNATPEEVKLILIDPKMLELSIYDGIPHLILPVVTEPKKAAGALRGIVGEMERRYHLMARYGVRHIERYNQMLGEHPDPAQGEGGDKLYYIVVVIDELADLMLVSSREVEDSIARLAQMARAAGIHLIVATQRPSVDVLTGVIKANFPARISYQVSSKVDSRTILDTIGAERLLGKGDLLFLPPGTSNLQRIHGAFVSETEIKRLVDYLRYQQQPVYDETIMKIEAGAEDQLEEEHDEKYEEAIQLVARTGQASISMIQRKLRVGYNRAARMIELMEKEGIVGPADGSKPREVYIRPDL